MGSFSIPMPTRSSSTCLDMRAIEELSNSKMQRDDSKVHHIIDDALFKPRQRVSVAARTHVRTHALAPV